MDRMIEESARQIPVIEEADVVVAGSGPAGIAAAWASAKAGAKTVIVERFGYLGGMITGARVVGIFGVGDGENPLVRGITQEIQNRLEKLGAVKPLRCGDYRVDAEVFKWQATEMLQEVGSNIRLHTSACMPILKDGKVSGIFVESKSGREAILGKVTIDATADADLIYRSGGACDNDSHEVTLGIKIDGINRQEVLAFADASPVAHEAAVQEATRLNGGVMLGKKKLLRDIDGANAEDLTRAEMQLRQECFESLNYLKDHIPGYEEAHVVETYPQIGVRQGRRVRGEYVLDDGDLKTSRHFDDGIGRMGVYFPDWGPTYAIHGLDYDVPYRTLVPECVDGLLVAGRCISCDYVACNTMRLIVPCFVTGQAAGCAAAVASRESCTPREIAIESVRTELHSQDVYLG